MILLAYAFDDPVPGTEIIERLKRVELACFGAVGEENGAPPLRASCGERHGMAFWSLDGGWEVGNGRAVADGSGVRCERPASGEWLEIAGDGLSELRFEGGRAWSASAAALEAFAEGYAVVGVDSVSRVRYEA